MVDKESVNAPMRNPFENHGNPVYGEEFIGRSDTLLFIEDRIVRPMLGGCASVYGQPRVGKTSLAFQSILRRPPGTFLDRRVAIKLSINSFGSPDEFFFSLVDEIAFQIRRRNWAMDGLDELAKAAGNSGPGHVNRLQRLFQTILEANYQCVVVLDDFDGAGRVFKHRPDCFEKLRVLGSESRVAWLTLSRRSVYEIEDRATGGSTLAGIMAQRCLGLYSEEEVGTCLARLQACIGPITATEQSLLFESCGAHPHLLAMIACDLVEAVLAGRKSNLEKLLVDRTTDFLSNFDHTVNALRDDRRLHKIFQVLFGPAIDVENEDIRTCLSYGLIREGASKGGNGGGEYEAYSTRFGDYLRTIERRQIEGDVWSIWVKAESALRHRVGAHMTEQLGKEWEAELERLKPERAAMIAEWRAKRSREERTLGTASMNALIDYAHVADLFVIIFDEWAAFKSVFERDERYWRSRADDLIQVRNALAHNRKIFRDQKTRVQGYCDEIVRVLSGR